MPERVQVAGRLQPDGGVGVGVGVAANDRPSRKLRQQKIFQFVIPSNGAQHECGMSKSPDDFQVTNSIPWGDSLTPAEDMDSHMFRILSHNVNGLSTYDNNEDVRRFAQAMQAKSVAVFGVQETNRNFANVAILQSFHSILRSVSTHHQGAVSSAKLQWPSAYQPGGTAVSVRDKWATRFLAKGSDRFGRWSWLTLTGQGTTKVTFISAYRVCDGASESSIISRTIRSQQEWMYADCGIGSVDLRNQFVVDVCTLVKNFQSQGHDIVLMLDANEALCANSAIERIIHECGLVDAHSSTSDTSPAPPTYQRGSKKIDFVLVSPKVEGSIKAASILALQDGYYSDHRALVIDCDSRILFGSETSDVVTPIHRRLTSTHPKAVHAYMTHMKKHMAIHNIVDKVSQLQQISASGQWTAEHVQEYELLDSLLDEGRIAAERKCRPKCSGRYSWSPELDKAGKVYQYWKLRLWEFSSQATNEVMLESLAAAAGISNSDRQWLPSKQTRAKKRKAQSDLRQVRQHARSLREQHLLEMAKLSSILHHMSETAAQSAILAREKSARQFRQLRGILKENQSYGVDRIDVPNEYAVLGIDEPVPRVPLVVKEDIEEVLRPHTIKRFRQHQETPFGSGERRTRLGLDCLSTDAEAILGGCYDRSLTELSPEAQAWLKCLKKRDYVNAGEVIASSISTKDWVAGWSKMRESTASAPRSHYGHYKTAAVAARLPEDHPDHNHDLAQTYAIMCSLPLAHGFAPRRWRGCVDAILEKIPGSPLIEKLRIIMLFEADFNFVLKCVWGKRLIRHAETHTQLGTINHGCRPGRQTSDALLEKLLIYEFARLSRTSLVTVDNDAKSCYDRVIKTLAMIACVSYGLPLMAAVMHNRTMHGMVHRMKTRHGYFHPYEGSDTEELEGVGQGSGAAPAIWLIYSVTLLAAFKNFSAGMHIVSPFETLIVSVLAVFYVDDGMPGVNDATEKRATPLNELVQQAEMSAQSWERLLFASGGALELSKCFVYILYWDLTGGTHRLLEPTEVPGCNEVCPESFAGPIGVTYGTNLADRRTLATESPWVGRRTLGVRIAPAGNWTDELTFRKSQARDLALRLSGAMITRETAWLGYRMMICPKIEFPLCITQFSQDECDSISSPILKVALSKMGYNRNMPREVVYGPIELGGLGLHDLYVEQGIRQLSSLVGHLRQGSKTGRLMHIELEWCQVQAGTSTNLLESPNISIDYIETCWIMGIRDFLRTYKLCLKLSPSCIQRSLPQCQADEFIMDALRLRGDCSPTDLQRLNACRMFLQVSRLSDITQGNGRVLCHDILQGNRSTFQSKSRWPRQGHPPQAWWSLWNRKVRQVFSTNGTSLALRMPLGLWNATISLTEWKTLYDPVSKQVYAWDVVDYIVLSTVESQGGRMHCTGKATGRCEALRLPHSSVPATLGLSRKNGCRCMSLRHRVAQTMECNQPTCFSDFVLQQPVHIRELLDSCDLSDETSQRLVDALYSSSALTLATDGGVTSKEGTFGYVFGNPDASTVVCTGKGRVPGGPSHMSSTRAELGAILAALTYLRLVLDHYNLVLPKDISIQGVCDSKTALSRLSWLQNKWFGTTWRCRAHYDLEAAIVHCTGSLHGIALTWTWVRSHASSRKQRYEFSWNETLNEAADELATAARVLAPTTLRDTNHWPEQVISVFGAHGRLVGDLAKEVRYMCTSPDLRSYWRGRYGWSSQQLATIDDIGLKSALSGMPWRALCRAQKLRCGWLPVNSREARHNPDRLPGCSACSPANLVPETVDHLFQCQSTARRSAVLRRLNNLAQDSRKWNTSKHIASALTIGCCAWIKGCKIPSAESLNLPDDEICRLVSKAYQEQCTLGWHAFFRGFLSRAWRQAQEAHLLLHPSPGHDDGDKWSRKVVRWIFDLFECVWALRNEVEHGADHETQERISLAHCERTVRRLYAKGRELPHCEQHPFRDPVETILAASLRDQQLWIRQTEGFLPNAIKRTRSRKLSSQRPITEFFPYKG